MKLRITEPGFQKLTGPIAEVMFEDGVSVNDVTEDQALRISAAMRCETLEGINPSAAAVLLRSLENRAPVVVEMDRGDVPHAVVEVAKPVEKKVQEPANAWTREQLEAVADKSGIKGLREIAVTFGVKATSIKELIDEVLAEQAKNAVKE